MMCTMAILSMNAMAHITYQVGRKVKSLLSHRMRRIGPPVPNSKFYPVPVAIHIYVI